MCVSLLLHTKSLHVNKKLVSKIHPLGDHDCAKFKGNPFNSCRDISIHRTMLLSWFEKDTEASRHDALDAHQKPCWSGLTLIGRNCVNKG